MSEVTPQLHRDQPRLIPALGIFSATMLVAGGVIGSGIFRKPGVMAAAAFHLPLIGDVAPFKELGVKGLATAVILVLTIVNYLGVRFGGVVQNVFSIAKMSAMVGLAVAVAVTPGVGHAANLTADSNVIRPTGLAWWAAVAAALQGAFWAYDGWHKITYIGCELKSPQW